MKLICGKHNIFLTKINAKIFNFTQVEDECVTDSERERVNFTNKSKFRLSVIIYSILTKGSHLETVLSGSCWWPKELM